MSLRTPFLASINGSKTVATQGILAVSDKLQMGGIAAVSDTTEVIDLHVGRLRTVPHLPGDNVNELSAPVILTASVSAITQSTRPFPAPCFPIDDRTSKKSVTRAYVFGNRPKTTTFTQASTTQTFYPKRSITFTINTYSATVSAKIWHAFTLAYDEKMAQLLSILSA
jgi:hypothetical protein